jgi:hypothetical protein
MFIRYLDFSFGIWEDAYLVKQEDDYCYYLSPTCVTWLEHLGLLHRLGEVDAPRISSHFFQYKESSDIRPYVPKGLFGFPIDEEDVPSMHYIADAFLQYDKYRRYPVADRLRRTIGIAQIFLSPSQVRRLFLHWTDQESTDDIRLRLLMDPFFESILEEGAG